MRNEDSRDILLYRSRFVKQKEYWSKKLTGEFKTTDILLAYDGNQPTGPNPGNMEISLPTELENQILKKSKGSDLSIYILLITALKILIYRYTFNQDIIIISPINKLNVTLETINHFVFIRDRVDSHLTFKQLVMRVRESVLQAYENQDYPFDKTLEFLFPLAEKTDVKLFSNILCSLENLHDPRTTRKISPRLHFHFQREENHIKGYISYDVATWQMAEVRQISTHLIHLLTNALENINAVISGISFLPEQERAQLLVEFNRKQTDFPRDRTIVHFIQEHARKNPDRTALVCLDETVTYRELEEGTRQLARCLRTYGVGREQPAAISLQRSVQMVKSILAAWKAGGAYIPLNPDYPNQRILEILEDSQTQVLITTSAFVDPDFQASCQAALVKLDEPDQELETGAAELNLETNINDMNCLSYIIYTSGSTGRPKGAMVEHIGMMNHMAVKIHDLQITEKSIVAQNASPTFDISVWQFFAALVLGGSTVIFPDKLVLAPEQFISRLIWHQVTILEVVPSYLSVILEFLSSNFKPFEALDYLVVTGETVPPSLVKRWFASYPGISMVNAYGPTEASDDITHFEMDHPYKGGTIPIGAPVQNLNIYIVDKHLNLCPIGVKGEILVSGIGVGRGYLNKPEQTAESFCLRRPGGMLFEGTCKDHGKDYMKSCNHAAMQLSPHPSPHCPIYMTGDLGRWLPDGNIEFFGRIDHQVKIRGFRIELGEVESQLSAHPLVKEAAVVVKENYEKYLCAFLVIVPEKNLDPDEMKNYLSNRLPYYMTPDHFVKLEQMPLTPNGKINRKALLQMDVGEPGKKEYTPPRNYVEEKLVEIWADVLKVEKTMISIDSDFFQLGGHSLRATIMIAKIQEVLKVKLPLVEVFKTPAIKGLSGIIKGLNEEKQVPIKPAENKEYYLLSPAQRRLYILQRIEVGNMSYNMPRIMSLDEKVDSKRLEKAFRDIISRHELLRTSFEMIEGEPVQRVHPHVEFDIQQFTDQGSPALPENIINQFIRPFDLSQPPLLRIGLAEVEAGMHLLLFDMHHIITDGISQVTLTEEFFSLYNGKELPLLRLHYKDYSEWWYTPPQQESMKHQKSYWLQMYSDEIHPLNLPLDYPRPSIQSFEGRRIDFAFNEEETRTLRGIGDETGATLFMSLLAVFNILLSKLSGQEDIIVGTPIGGRRHADLEKMVGMLINTLAQRNYPSGTKTFLTFLEEVKNQTLKALENQEYPFEELVESIDVKRDASRNPAFDVMLVLQNMEEADIKESDLKLKHHSYQNKTAKFDLTLTAFESRDRVGFTIEYCIRLFKEETIVRFFNYFKIIISSLAEDTGKQIAEIEIITGEEKSQLLYNLNDTNAEYPTEKVIHQLFAEQVERTPEHVALAGVHEIHEKNYDLFHMSYMSYKELNEKSNQLARLLLEKGVKPDTIVGITAERFIETIVGILGILKAGGAYLPIDPQYPSERIDYMLQDSNTNVLVTTTLLPEEGEKLRRWEGEKVVLTSAAAPSPSTLTSTSTCQVSPANLAYIIYTSGTTGRPKGVLITHENVVRLLFNERFQFDFNDTDVWTLFHSLCFDFSVWEMYGALLYGGRLVIIPKMTAREPREYLQILEKQNVTILNQTPSAFYHLVDLELQNQLAKLNIRYIIFGGEALMPIRLKDWKKKYPKTKIINMYGITETTVHVTFKEIGTGEIKENISNIGKPIPTLSTYVVDKYLKLVPMGVGGELCVGGAGVARGYLNQPQLTSEKFFVLSNRFHKSYRSYISGKIYKSGDLVKLLANEEMEYMDRIDQQVKIRGFRVELGEIQSQLVKHPGIKEAVVTTRKDNHGEKQVCAYLVNEGLPGNAPKTIELRKYLAKQLPDYMIPAYFVYLEQIPLTGNGKVDKQALPEPEIKADGDYMAPRNPIEKKLQEIWTGLLLTRKSQQASPHQLKRAIGIDDNFFELGGHSLKAAMMVETLHKEMDVKLPLAEVFRTPTIRKLSGTIKGLAKDKYEMILSIEEKEYYPLSSAQKRVYILQQMDENNISYNMPIVVYLEGELNYQRLEKSLKNLLQRHESLRSSFEIVNNEPVQKVHQQADLEIEYYLSSNGEEIMPKPIIRDFIRPFDLSRTPLMRTGLIKLEEKKHIFMADMHHIVSDGTSLAVLSSEFMALYEGKDLPPLQLRYKDYAQKQQNESEKEKIKKQEEYWLKEFQNSVPVLNLPIDYPRPPVQSFEGSRMNFELDSRETAKLKQIAAKEDTTLYMVLLAIFNILLSKLSGQEDIVVGIGTAGRGREEFRSIIGMFVNTLALRNYPTGEKSFLQFLEKVKEKTLAAFENQNYMFEDLAEKVVINRDTSRNPIFDVVFNFDNIELTGDIPEVEIPGLKLYPYQFESKVASFDLNITGMERGNQVIFSIEYCTKLFKKDTIKRYFNYLKEVVSAVINNENIKLEDISISHDLMNAKLKRSQKDMEGFQF